MVIYNLLRIIFCQVVPGLIQRPSEGCPEKTTGCYALGCPATCYCEDHCSWESCNLNTHPEECFDGVNGIWFRNDEGYPWVGYFHGK